MNESVTSSGKGKVRSFKDEILSQSTSTGNANILCVVCSRVDDEWEFSRGWSRSVRNVHEDRRHEEEMGRRYSKNNVSGDKNGDH